MSTGPAKGQMILFDCVEPPLEDGSYRLTVETDVTNATTSQELFSQQNFFDVVGPRFTIPPAMIAGVFPPNKGHGAFQDDLPHIVMSRRALPWERELDPKKRIPQPASAAGGPPPLQGPVPWMALLVFEEDEYTLLRDIPLQQAVPDDVFHRLGSPANVTCDAVEANESLVRAILPSLEELQLLAHVRWVNVEDRELNTAGGDGFYSVVVANRLPSPNAQCRAVLVSLEERSDLVQANPPATAPEPDIIDTTGTVSGTTAHALSMSVQEVLSASSAGSNQIGAPATPRQPIDVVSGGTFTASLAASPFSLSSAPVHTFTTPRQLVWNVGLFQQAKVRLVALASWQFTCEGPGTFRELMQHLDDAMFGTVAAAGHPALADTGHLKLTLQDRVGVAEDVWYRGPLVSSQLTRDPLGPYQSADQARRVTPDTGAEDISYAAAFEVGRLLAAADPRFAQAIMGWRRRSYKASARASTISDLAARARLTMPADQWYTPMAGLFATQAITSVVQSNPPIADAYGLAKVASAPGMQPNALATAWNLGSAARATTLLGGDPGTLGAVVAAAPQTTRPAVTVDFVIGDTAGFGRLTAARQQAFDNTAAKLGGR
jgi:hypothetical protein